jgi:hypothetical protein
VGGVISEGGFAVINFVSLPPFGKGFKKGGKAIDNACCLYYNLDDRFSDAGWVDDPTEAGPLKGYHVEV